LVYVLCNIYVLGNPATQLLDKILGDEKLKLVGNNL